MSFPLFLYFALAVLPAFLQAEHAPTDGWTWFKLIGGALYQGLLAVKAYLSQSPDKATDPAQPPANWSIKP